ncbi:MAG: DUF4147 domain-containing protein [Oscillibacter sp.]|nr:DUF4147 domain-containing protein [Oscillibacter sp.]
MTTDTILKLRQDALAICNEAISASLPDAAIHRALRQIPAAQGRTIVIAIGKAAWQSANAAYSMLESRAPEGVVITKYHHSSGPIGNFSIYEAGHPVPDENSVAATRAAIKAVQNLTAQDQVLLLISGGGSALFESPLVPLEELKDITQQLLACGADITQMNTIRKRLSTVKGGRFGTICAPAHVYAILLSDIVGDSPNMIASGPAYPDASTSEQALELARRYSLQLSDQAWKLLGEETPKDLPSVTTMITGGVRQLCADAVRAAEKLGYETILLTDCLQCEAREAGRFLSAMALTHVADGRRQAYVLGGETFVHLTGKGLGGRNQELALAAAEGLSGLANAVVVSVGSDGTDGPTNAAGGIVDGTTASVLAAKQISIPDTLADNDAYHALEKCDGLVITGPTGTNVNDVTLLLLN